MKVIALTIPTTGRGGTGWKHGKGTALAVIVRGVFITVRMTAGNLCPCHADQGIGAQPA